MLLSTFLLVDDVEGTAAVHATAQQQQESEPHARAHDQPALLVLLTGD